jgi:hypothetical protein
MATPKWSVRSAGPPKTLRAPRTSSTSWSVYSRRSVTHFVSRQPSAMEYASSERMLKPKVRPQRMSSR